MKSAQSLRTALSCGLLAASLGCPSSSEGTDDGASTSAGDDDATTMAPTTTDMPATTSGMVDGTASSGGSDDSTPVDPTGDIPPAVDCGAGGTHMGAIEIHGDEDIAQLDGIAVVTGDLIISDTTYANLDFLSCLTEVQGDIEIYANEKLFDLSGTDNLVSVGRLPKNTPTPTNPDTWDNGKGSISITDNPGLGEINGFSNLVQIGGQGEAGDCSGAPADVVCLAQESLSIRNNDAAITVSGFSSLQFIYGSLVIQQNDNLRDIDGLSALIGVGSAFLVTDNPNLCMSSVSAVGEALQTIGNMEQSNTEGNDQNC